MAQQIEPNYVSHAAGCLYFSHSVCLGNGGNCMITPNLKIGVSTPLTAVQVLGAKKENNKINYSWVSAEKLGIYLMC